MDYRKINGSYRVRHNHFADFCHVPGSVKLKFGSLPTLLLPNFHEPPTEENSLFVYATSASQASTTAEEMNIPSNSTEAARSPAAEMAMYVPINTSDVQVCPPNPSSSQIASTSRELVTPSPPHTEEKNVPSTSTEAVRSPAANNRSDVQVCPPHSSSSQIATTSRELVTPPPHIPGKGKVYCRVCR